MPNEKIEPCIWLPPPMKMQWVLKHRNKELMMPSFLELLDVLGPDYYISPSNPDATKDSNGSLCGLCASADWLDGMKVLLQRKANPNLNRLCRPPLLEALYNRSTEMVRLLLVMGADPLVVVFDDRTNGISRSIPLTNLSQFEPELGSFDREAADWAIQKGCFYARSAIARHLLNRPRAGDHQILSTLLEANWSIDDDTRYYAQFFYANCIRAGLREEAEAVRTLFGITPDPEIVCARLGLFMDGLFGSQ